MASSSEIMKDVEKKWSKICLDEEEEFITKLEDEELNEVEYDDRWCLIGRLLSGKILDYQVFQNIVVDLWKPGKGMYVKILEQNRFLFQFYHEIDIDRVIIRSRWTYDRKHFLIERLQPGDNPRTKLINHLDLCDVRNVDLNVVNGENGPSIVINENDSTFMSDAELTILDLKRKRVEKVSNMGSHVENICTVDYMNYY
ncbi:hypothetical protein G4B88_014406 [Cannabis sativa]|uniref:DUF4283 domain-containing protein n=1 Tax=Cannabis sativa TaxID=3483 RepID=A0A7J6IBD2_CANSA|nr:hypothetical protein G4B88_014406 [Cannabis sativa]